MVTKLAENLYTIPVPLPNNPLKNLNTYVLTGSRNLLIDTGFHQDACREALEAGLRELGISMEDTDIFLTHLHSDHTGLAPDIRGKNTKIFIGAYDLSHMPGSHSTFSWKSSDERFAAEGFPRELLAVLTERNPAQGLSPVPYDDYIPVQDGDHFCYGGHDFQAILTPGHTPGHLCLYEEKTGICILGDSVLFDITPNITRWVGMEDSLGDYLKTLERLKKLSVTMPLPAHRTSQTDLSGRCDALIAHHQRRCQEVRNILSGKLPMTAWDVASHMTWKIRCNSWADFPTPQKWFAVGEAMAHLDHLIALGEVLRTTDGKLYYYELPCH
jgi:glyoxylase-like metal-dependent hydrolase (beta-lactamase superfamily II)